MANSPMKVVLAPERLQAAEHIVGLFAKQSASTTMHLMPPPGLSLMEPLAVKFGGLSSSNSTDVGSASSVCLSDDEFDDDSNKTSVILKNIVGGCDRQTVVSVLSEQGFLEAVNFLYVPMAFDKAKLSSFGYAFISFTSPAVASRFRDHFTGFKSWGAFGATADGCHVEWCGIQGLAAHINRYRNSPMMHDSVPDEYKPMLLSSGIRLPFPHPTEMIKAPRYRRHKNQKSE